MGILKAAQVGAVFLIDLHTRFPRRVLEMQGSGRFGRATGDNRAGIVDDRPSTVEVGEDPIETGGCFLGEFHGHLIDSLA